jgi:hypothetical protein
MTDVQKAEATIAKLTQKYSELQSLAAKIEAQRASIALSAFEHGGDDAASLHALNKEGIEIELDLRNLAGAIEQAKARRDEARRHEALAEERHKAAEVQDLFRQFREHAVALDAALTAFADHGRALFELQRAMNLRGQHHPNSDVMRTHTVRAVAAAFMNLPSVWFKMFEMPWVAPNDRGETFSKLADEWSVAVERWVSVRIGKKEAA